MRLLPALFLLLVPAVAAAAPQTLAWSGRILDVTGAPLDGDVDLTVRLYPDASADPDDALFSESFAGLTVRGGYAAVVLGAGAVPLEDTAFDAESLWVEVMADERVLGPPRLLHGAPYAHTATRVGVVGNGLHTQDGDVVVEGDLRVEGVTQLDSVQIGERHILSIDGEACTHQPWQAVISNLSSHTLVHVRMSFSHCQDGCHHAYRDWTGLYNSYRSAITLEDSTSYGSNAGTWSVTRDPTPNTNNSFLTTFRKSADPTHSFCGEVNVWVESNHPISLVSQSG